MDIKPLSKKEIEIMAVLWKENRALTSSEIVDLSAGSTWKSNSIHILLNALLKKGAIEVESFRQTTKTYARTFTPTYSFEEYTVSQMQGNKSFTNKSVPKIVSALFDSDKMSPAEKEEMKAALLAVIDKKMDATKEE